MASFWPSELMNGTFFHTRLLGSGFYPHLDFVVSFDRFALSFYRHSVYTSAMAEKS